MGAGVTVGVLVGSVSGVGVVSPGTSVPSVPAVPEVSKGEDVTDNSDRFDGSDESEGEPVVVFPIATGTEGSDGSVERSGTPAEVVDEISGSMRGFENIASAPRMNTKASERSRATPMTVRRPSPGFR